MAPPSEIAIIHQGRQLMLRSIGLAFVRARDAATGAPRRTWVNLIDYPQKTSARHTTTYSGHAEFPDVKIHFEPAENGFWRIQLSLQPLAGSNGPWLYEGHRLSFTYTGQHQLKNHQTYFSYHSFAFNGVMKEQTRAIALADGAPKVSRTTRLLYNERRGVAWWVSCLKSKTSPECLFLGAESAEVFKTTFTIVKMPGHHEVTVYQGLQREYLPLEGGLRADAVLINVSDRALETFGQYGRLVGDRRGAKPAKSAAQGWATWYEYYTRINQPRISEQAGRAATSLAPKGLNLFQIDDGYQPKIGDWTHDSERFPAGMQSTAAEIAAHGLVPGIWFAPFLADKDSLLARETARPEWFLHDFSGRRLTYTIPRHSVNYILDITHPDVQCWLRKTVQNFKAWGFKFFKIDFLFLAAAEARRHQAGTPSLAAYSQGVKLIREEAGDQIHILHSGSIDLAGLGHGDSNRTGPDIAYDVLGGGTRLAYIKAQLTATAAHHFMAHRWFVPDPDAVMLRVPLSEALAEVMIAQAAMTGGNYLISDAVETIPPQRLHKMIHPLLLEIAAHKGELLPLDYFEAATRIKLPPNPLMIAPALNPPSLWLWTQPVTGRRTLFVYNLSSRMKRLDRDLNRLCVQVCGKPLFSDELSEDIFHGQTLKIRDGILRLEMPGHSVRIFPLD